MAPPHEFDQLLSTCRVKVSRSRGLVPPDGTDRLRDASEIYPGCTFEGAVPLYHELHAGTAFSSRVPKPFSQFAFKPLLPSAQPVFNKPSPTVAGGAGFHYSVFLISAPSEAISERIRRRPRTSVHRGETDIGVAVQIVKLLQNHFSDVPGRNFVGRFSSIAASSSMSFMSSSMVICETLRFSQARWFPFRVSPCRTVRDDRPI
jgi:hypothetical protein